MGGILRDSSAARPHPALATQHTPLPRWGTSSGGAAPCRSAPWSRPQRSRPVCVCKCVFIHLQPAYMCVLCVFVWAVSMSPMVTPSRVVVLLRSQPTWGLGPTTLVPAPLGMHTSLDFNTHKSYTDFAAASSLMKCDTMADLFTKLTLGLTPNFHSSHSYMKTHRPLSPHP